jgi:hypothetical protein
MPRRDRVALRQVDDVQPAGRAGARDEGTFAVGRDRDAAAGHGDFDGDGITDKATWMSPPAQWGASGDLVIPGDYDGDGRTDLAVHRAVNEHGWWIIWNSSTNAASIPVWGAAGAKGPCPGPCSNPN